MQMLPEAPNKEETRIMSNLLRVCNAYVEKVGRPLMRLLITDVQFGVVHVVKHNKRWRMSMKTWNPSYLVTLKQPVHVQPHNG